MPFLMLRTASVLAAGFLLTGPSAPAAARPSSASGSLPVGKAASCPDRWAGHHHHDWQAQPAGLNSRIRSVSALSPADVWVTGSALGAPEAWHFDGSSWTDHPPTLYSDVRIDAAALGSSKILYLAGNNEQTRRGIILSYDGSHWTDLSPVNPPSDYKALAITADGTLIAAGGGRGDGTLQEKSGTTWATVSLSAPVNTITRVSVAAGGTVYGVGSAAGNKPVLIEQLPGRRSASVLDAPAAAATSANKAGPAALGLDVWLLGRAARHGWWHHSWNTHQYSGFVAVRRSMSRVTGPGQPCWLAGAPLPGRRQAPFTR